MPHEKRYMPQLAAVEEQTSFGFSLLLDSSLVRSEQASGVVQAIQSHTCDNA